MKLGIIGAGAVVITAGVKGKAGGGGDRRRAPAGRPGGR
jgi:hypothetical protein